MKKVILDLCGGTGAWSAPYAQHPEIYDVRNITLPDYDVRTYKPPENVHGILAAPPCTHLAISGARWWRAKGEEALLEALSIVDACLRIVIVVRPKWWALENPVGRLVHYLGAPKLYYQPWEYGDPWTKRTALWGDFTIPHKHPVEPIGQWTGRADTPGIADHLEFLPPDWIHKMSPSSNRTELRSVTPQGFARAFFESNP